MLLDTPANFATSPMLAKSISPYHQIINLQLLFCIRALSLIIKYRKKTAVYAVFPFTWNKNAQNRNRTSDTRIFSPLLYQLSYLGIDYKSLSCGSRIWTCDLRVMSPTSFQTAPSRDIKLISQKRKADDRTRTDNLLITNQLLCQLSHIGL